MYHEDSPVVTDEENSSAFYNTNRSGKASKKQLGKDLRRKIFNDKPDLKPEAASFGEEEQIGQDTTIGQRYSFTLFTPTNQTPGNMNNAA